MSELAALRPLAESFASPMIVPAYHSAALRGDRITNLMRKDFEIMRTVLDAGIRPPEPADGGGNVGAEGLAQSGLSG